MTKNPLINAFGATTYIVVIVCLLNFVIKDNMGGRMSEITTPLVMLSLLTLSTAVMAYIFFYQPVLLLIDGKKKAAVNLFLQTTLAFATITAVILVALTTGVLGN